MKIHFSSDKVDLKGYIFKNLICIRWILLKLYMDANSDIMKYNFSIK